jgi:hypothetical protein
MGNVVNRVFDSSGPEGKVRGTPQQIIEKYNQLARDAQLSNDRVAAENFQQHAEHYTRMLGEAMREQEAQRVQQQGGPQGRPDAGPRENRRDDDPRRDEGEERRHFDEPRGGADTGYDVVIDMADDEEEEGGLVETPESAPQEPPEAEAPRPPRRRRARKGGDGSGNGDGPGNGDGSGPDVKPEAAE